MSDPLLSIIVLTCGRLGTTVKYLRRAVAQRGYDHAELVVWDNGSTDGTAEWLQKQRWGLPMTLVCNDHNIGFFALMEVLAHCAGQYVIKLDDDISVPFGYAKHLVSAVESAPEPTGIVSLDVKMAAQPAKGTPPQFYSQRIFVPSKKPQYGVPLRARRNWRTPLGQPVVIADPTHRHRQSCAGACRIQRMDVARKCVIRNPFKWSDYQLTTQTADMGYWWGYLLGIDRQPVIHHGGMRTKDSYRHHPTMVGEYLGWGAER